ncbi:MAG TPA: NfeD family protein [Caldilineae bacterium]|nr:NfeD family protein [Caldilineae bacterium]
MDVSIIKWIWLIIAMLFFLAEVMTVGFVLAAFGVGALAAFLVALLGFDLQWQLLVFVVVSAISVVLSRRFADRVTGEQAEGVGVDRVLGKYAVVLTPIEPREAKGRVRVEREEWRAESEDGQVIPVDTIVQVVRVEGTRLIVRPAPDQEI